MQLIATVAVLLGMGLYVAHAQPTPEGPEFQINTVTAGNQFNPDVCIDGSGNFVVVWESAGGAGIQVRLYAADGTPQTGELAVSASADDRPTVACESSGEFVVVWPDLGDVMARRYDASGTPLGAAFPVNDFTTGSQTQPHVAMNDAGDFVVTWNDAGGRDGSFDGIFGRRFDGTGAPVGVDFPVNTVTTGSQDKPVVDMTESGSFVVVWRDAYAVTGQRFDASGNPAGGEFVVNDADSELRRDADVAVTPSDGFVVAWNGDDYDGYRHIFARRYDASGAPLAATFEVDGATRYPEYSRVGVDGGGNFVVVWTNYQHPPDTDGYGVFARAFEADETPRGSQFLVNTETSLFQGDLGAGLSVAPNGDFVVVWHSGDDQDGDGYGIFGQRFSNPLPPGACTAAPLGGCRTAVVPMKSKLTLVNDGDDAHDRLAWKWVRGAETTQADLGDPTTTDDYALCLYDESGTPELIVEAAVPAAGTCPTKPCWKALGTPPGTKGYKYKDRDRTPNGVLKVVAKTGIDGKAKIVAKAGGDNLDTAAPGLPSVALGLPVRLQLQRAGGECWEALFESGGVLVNDGTTFRAIGG